MTSPGSHSKDVIEASLGPPVPPCPVLSRAEGKAENRLRTHVLPALGSFNIPKPCHLRSHASRQPKPIRLLLGFVLWVTQPLPHSAGPGHPRNDQDLSGGMR